MDGPKAHGGGEGLGGSIRTVVFRNPGQVRPSPFSVGDCVIDLARLVVAGAQGYRRRNKGGHLPCCIGDRPLVLGLYPQPAGVKEKFGLVWQMRAPWRERPRGDFATGRERARKGKRSALGGVWASSSVPRGPRSEGSGGMRVAKEGSRLEVQCLVCCPGCPKQRGSRCIVGGLA